MAGEELHLDDVTVRFYVEAMLWAANRATFEASMVQQLMTLGATPVDAGSTLLHLREQAAPVVVPGFALQPKVVVGFDSGRRPTACVGLVLRGVEVGQVSVAAAYAHAGDVAETQLTARNDSGYLTYLMGSLGLTEERAAAAVQQRADIAGSRDTTAAEIHLRGTGEHFQSGRVSRVPGYDPVSAGHLWVTRLTFQVSPDAAAPAFLDHENMIDVQGPACLYCEGLCSETLTVRPCPGKSGV